MHRPRIAVTTGDPAGIGPEIAAKAALSLRDRVERGEMQLVLLGSIAAHQAAVAELGIDDPASLLKSDGGAAPHPGIAFIDVSNGSPATPLGKPTPEGGRVACEAITRSVQMALGGIVDAICTGPISKEALNAAGYHYSGHTEFLAELTGARDSVMLLVHDNMRVSHVSTHVAIEKVPEFVTQDRLRRVVALTDQALRDLRLPRRRIAIAALNPHAGEGGLFGRQDMGIVEPLIGELNEAGLDVVGPVSGDTVFVRLRASQYDAVVAMYHDQGHIPVKLLGFSVNPLTGEWDRLSGVNITLGLPIIRTSVDHGTAFDIAGRGIANESSLIEAVDMAILLASSRPAQEPVEERVRSVSEGGA